MEKSFRRYISLLFIALALLSVLIVTRLFGFETSENFRSPYLSLTPTDFWNRWHITLSTWLRDYIFFPLRRVLLRSRLPGWLADILPPLVTMFVSGLWHGAGWTFIVWGLSYGVLIVIYQTLGMGGAWKPASKFTQFLAWLVMFTLIIVSFAVFRAPSLTWLAVRGADPGALFVAVNKSGRMASLKHMTPKTVYNMLSKRATEAGVKSFSPHDMRRTFVSDLLDAGADITTVSKMAGHANVTTTARYDRRPEDAKRKEASGFLLDCLTQTESSFHLLTIILVSGKV